MSRLMTVLIPGIILITLIFLEYMIATLSYSAVIRGETPIELFLPRPSAIFEEAIGSALIILPELWHTLKRAGLGLFIGLGLAIGITYIGILHSSIRAASRLITYSVNAFPLVGFAPLIILIFGQGSEAGMIFLAMLLSYFPIYISIENALNTIPLGLRDLSKIMKLKPHREFTLIILPEIKGSVLNSLRLAVPASIVGATIGEWLGAQHGIGRLVTVSMYQFNSEMLYASLLYIIVFNIFFLFALTSIEKKIRIPRK